MRRGSPWRPGQPPGLPLHPQQAQHPPRQIMRPEGPPPMSRTAVARRAHRSSCRTSMIRCSHPMGQQQEQHQRMLVVLPLRKNKADPRSFSSVLWEAPFGRSFRAPWSTSMTIVPGAGQLRKKYGPPCLIARSVRKLSIPGRSFVALLAPSSTRGPSA